MVVAGGKGPHYLPGQKWSTTCDKQLSVTFNIIFIFIYIIYNIYNELHIIYSRSTNPPSPPSTQMGRVRQNKKG